MTFSDGDNDNKAVDNNGRYSDDHSNKIADNNGRDSDSCYKNHIK